MMGVSWIIPVVVTTFGFEVPHRTASPQRLPHHSGTCVPQTRFKKHRIPATGFTDSPVTRQLQSLPLQGKEGSELPPPVSTAGHTHHTSMPYYVSSRHEGETSPSCAGIRTLPPRRPWRISHDSSRHHHPDVRSGFSHSPMESAVVQAASTWQGSGTFPHRICNSPSMSRLRHAVAVLKYD